MTAPSFNAFRGGHASEALREEFQLMVLRFKHAISEPLVDADKAKLRWLCGQLWNCRDIMPAFLCDAIYTRHGASYATGARQTLVAYKMMYEEGSYSDAGRGEGEQP